MLNLSSVLCTTPNPVSSKERAIRHQQPTTVHGVQADVVSLVQILYYASREAAVVCTSFSERRLHQADCVAV